VQPVEHPFEQQAHAPEGRWRGLLPDSGALDHRAFNRRRRALVYVVLAHVPALLCLALVKGIDTPRAVALGVVIPTLLAITALAMRKRSHASVLLASGLVYCSTALLHLTDGSVAANAHAVLVVVACVLLQQWAGLVWSVVALVAAQGVAPSLGPVVLPDLYLAPGGLERPWFWGPLDALLLVAVVVPSIVSWKALEDLQNRAAELAWEATNAAQKADKRRAQSLLALSLSRRNQALLEQQLEELDVLELEEADADALAGLFRLDHLATRMRRNAESLLVMSGDEPPRFHGPAAPLSEVVRAAVGEVEQYTRVEVMLTEDPLVAGPATADLTHLLAELVDNATTFSPRSSLVVISGQATSDGYELRIKDRGRGMTEQALHERNRQLAHPPDLDLELASMLGLHVCGRLAKRVSVGVALERNGNGGTTASVIVPSIHLSHQAAPVRRELAAALAALEADEDEVPEEGDTPQHHTQHDAEQDDGYTDDELDFGTILPHLEVS
jgi:signal transduction histidine kinase